MLVPGTTIRTTHALAIATASGRVIGAIHGWEEQQSRQVDEVFTVRPGNYDGLPEDIVPQNLTGRTLRVRRVDLFRTPMEDAFGATDVVLLTDEANAFDLLEIWRTPGSGLSLAATAFGAGNAATLATPVSNLISTLPEPALNIGPGAALPQSGNQVLQFATNLIARPKTFSYKGCVFTEVGRQSDATSARVVQVNATIVWKKKVKVR